MPYRKRKYNKKKRKRRGRRRMKYRKRRKNLRVGFPLKYTCKLRYTDTIVLDAPSDGTAYHTFRANNIYDPDYSGTGHQPRHFDMLAEIYDNYTVIGSKLSAKIVGYSNSSDDAQAIGIRISPDASLQTPNTDIAALHEMGRSAATTWTMVKSTEPLQTRTITKKWSQRRMKTIGGSTNDDVLMGTTTGAGPGKQDYFTVFTTAAGMLADIADNPPQLRLLITVDYICVFTGMKGNLPQD